ncbi:MAG: RNA polymerase factor sigma-54 [Firmicutes bacterium]|nr:RNA polymerase factor sigma-54 [Bacillota bacterium]
MSKKLKLALENAPKLVVTPKLRQALTILQLPAYELTTYLQQELAANPVVELDRPWEEPVGDDPYLGQEWLEYWFDDLPPSQGISREQTSRLPLDCGYKLGQDKLQELTLQIRTQAVAPELQELAVTLLEQLDCSGFLPCADVELAQALGTTEEKVFTARRLLQRLEPRGLGCYNLADYLCLELEARGWLRPHWEQAIRDYLPQLAAGRVAQVAAALACPAGEIQELLDLMQELPPRPGAELSGGRQNQFILPDVVIEKRLGTYEVVVNESLLPRLALSPYYLRLSQETPDAEVQCYIEECIRAAAWLIRSLEQRRQTLHDVALAIVAGQHDFFEHGLAALRPLTLTQVAASLHLHESTVSRAVAHKYMQTSQGIYPMRFFFTSGVADSSGLGLAKEGVQEAIRQLLATEDAKAPWSDQEIADLLQKKKGITISRRTVGKYREEMGILSSRHRKRYHM